MLDSTIIIMDYLSYSLQQAVAASQASCWSKQSRRENDEDADSRDDKDGHSDIPQFPSCIWCKLATALAQYGVICHQARLLVMMPSDFPPQQSNAIYQDESVLGKSKEDKSSREQLK